jgi:hypothetical protein
MKKLLLLLTWFAAAAFGDEPNAADALREALRFPQRDLAAFDQKLAAARAGGLPENETLFQELTAAWIHGDRARLESVLSRIEKASVPEPPLPDPLTPSIAAVREALSAAKTDPGAFARQAKSRREAWIRSQATTTLEDLRLIDAATDQWAIENNKKFGDIARWDDIKIYFKDGRLKRTGASVAGHSYGPQFIVDTPPCIPAKTWAVFEGIVPWKTFDPFPIASEAK